ncbi:MAG: DNA polymerase III subunit gamma/tau [Bacteroidia bacterium]|nr:DNA polymerase III subunit gamma/tau [Bacteroidia bacterium]
MEAFIVSARKYRPQHFNTVVGQSHITNTLKNAIAHKQLAQAYLFCGPRGVGKTTCARIFAKTINCFNITPEGEACDKCESCQSFNSGQSLNVYELDAASNNSVEDIRNLVDQVRFAPQLGEYKVYIIDEVHMLSTAAFNAFLKTLEEPPKHAKFILATTEKHKIIPTILSRCQVFNFNRIKNEDISNHLAHIAKTENVSFEPEALHVIAQKADGGLRDACSIFDQMVAFTGNHLTYKTVVENLHVLDFDYYFKITDFLLNQKLPEIMLTFDDILKKGFDAHNFLIGLGEHLRNVMVSRDSQTVQLLEISDNLKPKYAEQATRCSLPFLLKSLALISKTDVSYKSAKNPRLLVEMTLMQMAYINTAQNMDAEKKNELEPVFQQNVTVNNAATAKPVLSATPEKIVKTTDKPVVPFSELKIKAQFSLSEAIKNNSVATVETVGNSAEVPFENKSFNFEELQKAIHEFANAKNAAGNRQLYTTLTTARIELTDTNLAIMFIHNEAQKEILTNVRQEFLDNIRQQLSNNTVGLDIRIEEAPVSTAKVYKPSDKFKFLAEKNPALLELKKRFDLELDY